VDDQHRRGRGEDRKPAADDTPDARIEHDSVDHAVDRAHDADRAVMVASLSPAAAGGAPDVPVDQAGRRVRSSQAGCHTAAGDRVDEGCSVAD